MTKAIEKNIESVIEKPLAMKGLSIVLVRMIQGSKSKCLQILLEDAKTGAVTIDQIAQASRTISAILDVEECVSGVYNLEVSSPGVDRPLVKPEDYEIYMGFEASIETNLPIDGRRRFKGQLVGFEGSEVAIKVDQATYQIPINNIRQAKLVVTDALMDAHKQGKFLKSNPTTREEA